MVGLIVAGICFAVMAAVFIGASTFARRTNAEKYQRFDRNRPFGRPMNTNSVSWTGRRFLGDDEPEINDDDAPEPDARVQCPISNACPMRDARQCERWGECYWEEQDRIANSDDLRSP